MSTEFINVKLSVFDGYIKHIYNLVSKNIRREIYYYLYSDTEIHSNPALNMKVFVGIDYYLYTH